MRISKSFSFEAAHTIPNHPKCGRLHGHSYRLVVELEGTVNPDTGFVMDYWDLGRMVDPIVERFDHRFLNCFVRISSAENIATHIAHFIWTAIKVSLSKIGPPEIPNIDRLVVRVSETAKTWAVWDSARREDVLVLNEGLEAGWRDPGLNRVPVHLTGQPLDQIVSGYEKKMKEAAEQYFQALFEYEQARLYAESVTELTPGKSVQ